MSTVITPHHVLFVRLFVFCHLFGSGSRGKQLKQGHPDTPLPSYIHQLLLGDTETSPGQPREMGMPETTPQGDVQEAF